MDFTKKEKELIGKVTGRQEFQEFKKLISAKLLHMLAKELVKDKEDDKLLETIKDLKTKKKNIEWFFLEMEKIKGILINPGEEVSQEEKEEDIIKRLEILGVDLGENPANF